LVRELETFPDDGMSFAAMHPRLKAAMNVTDLAYFVAEHDDYHLARISELLGQASGPEEKAVEPTAAPDRRGMQAFPRS
jgi:hypothetical protein